MIIDIIRLNKVTKIFSDKAIFKNISLDIVKSKPLIITGSNGSGKTTLLKLISGIEKPSLGNINYSKYQQTKDGYIDISYSKIIGNIMFINPEMQLYQELTGKENLLLFSRLYNCVPSEDFCKDVLIRVGLINHVDKLLKFYSSGMKSRLKYALLLLIKPDIILLDEPTSNLDDEGKQCIYDIISELITNSILIIATNEFSEYHLGYEVFNLSKI